MKKGPPDLLGLSIFVAFKPHLKDGILQINTVLVVVYQLFALQRGLDAGDVGLCAEIVGLKHTLSAKIAGHSFIWYTSLWTTILCTV